jgi:hypothetical protein
MIPGIVDSAVGAARSFTDEFPGDGALEPRWSATRGTWTKTSGDAVTSTAASSYPLLSFNANTRQATVRTEGGTANTFGWGVSFWVVDNDNWWAAVVDRTTFTCQVGSTTGCCACGSDPILGACGPDGSCACYVCDGGGCIGNCTFVGYAGTCTYPVFGTCYNYNLKLISSVNGSISTISTTTIIGDTSAALTIGYVQVALNSAGQITATAQMSTGGTIAQIQTTPVSPNRGRRYGVIVTPASNGTQSSGLERFVYAPN